jgi:hypothetical protein
MANFYLKSEFPFWITGYFVHSLILPAEVRWVGIVPVPWIAGVSTVPASETTQADMLMHVYEYKMVCLFSESWIHPISCQHICNVVQLHMLTWMFTLLTCHLFNEHSFSWSWPWQLLSIITYNLWWKALNFTWFLCISIVLFAQKG